MPTSGGRGDANGPRCCRDGAGSRRRDGRAPLLSRRRGAAGFSVGWRRVHGREARSDPGRRERSPGGALDRSGRGTRPPEPTRSPPPALARQDLTQAIVSDHAGIRRLVEQGQRMRTVGSTAMNATSSRSHSIFTIVVEMNDVDDAGQDHIRVGKVGAARAGDGAPAADRKQLPIRRVGRPVVCPGRRNPRLVRLLSQKGVCVRTHRRRHLRCCLKWRLQFLRSAAGRE